MARSLMAALLAATIALAGCTDGVDADDCIIPDAPGAGDNPIVVIHTEMGCISAEIFVDQVPETGGNFVALARAGTYDGSPFHRVISDFMMQGGDHTHGNGQGGRAHPDHDTGDGSIEDEYTPDLRHDQPGRLSMANRGPGTGGSQFFITFVPTPWLDGYDENGDQKNCGATDAMGRPISCHAVFGQVIEGMDIVEQVNAEIASPSGTPRETLTFLEATVLEPSS